ncbi:hypothetical protein [Marine gokushovirus]|nr:hypothetical protein [Marine gokushovirus]
MAGLINLNLTSIRLASLFMKGKKCSLRNITTELPMRPTKRPCAGRKYCECRKQKNTRPIILLRDCLIDILCIRHVPNC